MEKKDRRQDNVFNPFTAYIRKFHMLLLNQDGDFPPEDIKYSLCMW